MTGQQVSAKAAKTVWERMAERFGTITPEAIAAARLSPVGGPGATDDLVRII